MLDPASPYLLAPFAGAEPAAPEWFVSAVRAPHTAGDFLFDGTRIELLCWGEIGRPGLLFLHGSGAHANWFAPIAPLLSDRFRVAAISWSGMGGSGWREAYSVDAFAEEAIAAATAARLFDGGPPVIVAHSFGGGPALAAAARHGDRLAGVIVADCYVDPVTQNLRRPASEPRHRVYTSLPAALARFRFSPAQDCRNLFYADWIARHSLRQLTAREGQPAGWSWRFDPTMWARMGRSDSWSDLANPRCPLAALRGERSAVIPDDRWALIQGQVPAGTEFVTIANAAHHLMVDQPLVFASEVGRIAARWQSSAGSASGASK